MATLEFEDDLDIDDDDLNLKNTNKSSGSKASPSSPKGSPKGRVIGGAPKGGKPIGKIPKGQNDKNNNKTIMMIAGIAVGVCVIGGVIFAISQSKAKKEQLALQQAYEQQLEEQNKTSSSSDEVSTGIPNLYGDGKEENTSALTSEDLILKDLNGNTISPNYVIKEQKTVTDYINYVKYRATTGNGMEFYWLEAVYKKQPCKVQVPYSIYSKLDSEGITVVDAEILVLEDGSEIVSYMSVRKDAKSLLEQ